jgi:hypothetical protein
MCEQQSWVQLIARTILKMRRLCERDPVRAERLYPREVYM